MRLDWLVHGSTTRAFNPAPGEKADELLRLAKLWGVKPRALLFANQRHTNNIAFLDSAQFNRSYKTLFAHESTDAVGTDVPGVLASVFTADCVPIFLVDVKARRFVLIHSGWRGTLTKIARCAMNLLIERDTNPCDVVVWVGPAIGQCCYEVSGKLASRFSDEYPALPQAIRGRYVDLKAINAHQIEQCGVPRANIYISDICTKCKSDVFYSYRAEGNLRGRILSAAMIKGKKMFADCVNTLETSTDE